MTRVLSASLLALSLSVWACPLSAQSTVQGPPRKDAEAALAKKNAAVADILWNDPAHQAFFRYQTFLEKICKDQGVNLKYDTAQTWKNLSLQERFDKVMAGEAYLKKLLEEAANQSFLGFQDEKLIHAVWGDQVAAGLKTLTQARGLKDPEQIKAAQEGLKNLTVQLGGLNIDWQGVFDGARSGPMRNIVDPYQEAAEKDYLKAEKSSPFLDALEAPEVRQVLATKESYGEFLKEKKVPLQAMPSMMSMYDVLTRAPEEEKKEMAHLLPTVVKFLNDGKSIVMSDMPGALGFAMPGKYDRPEMVGISPNITDADPLIAGKTLAHEFQHIYDMYTGRYYTMDSELRGFKTAVLFFQAVKKTSPEKYQQLMNSDDDNTRLIAKGVEEYSEAYEQSPQAFYQSVAVGYGYSRWHEGVFMGRVPLREAVNPTFGAPRELAALQTLREKAQEKVDALEKQQAAVRARSRREGGSRELDKELEKATTDLQIARSQFNHYDSECTLKEIRLRRMRSEVGWLDQKSQARGEKDPPPFDMSLAVDRDYVTP